MSEKSIYTIELDARKIQEVVYPTTDAYILLQQFGKVLDLILEAQSKSLAASPTQQLRKAILQDRLVTLGALLENGGGNHPIVKAAQRAIDEALDEISKYK